MAAQRIGDVLSLSCEGETPELGWLPGSAVCCFPGPGAGRCTGRGVVWPWPLALLRLTRLCSCGAGGFRSTVAGEKEADAAHKLLFKRD